MASKSSMVDLGKKYPSVSEVSEKIDDEDRVNYPSFNVNDVEALDNLPDGEFTFTAVGKVISHSERTDRDGKRHCSCEIEIHSIQPTGKSSEENDDLDSAMDKIADKKSKVVVDDEDEESEE